MKIYPNINYSFAPSSYWSAADPLAAILRNVKGANRRKIIRDRWLAGKVDELDPEILSDEVDDARKRLGRIHPSFLGGEYLPGYLPLEVEIARISLESTTSDIISLRAHPTGQAIGYRVVDEYRGKFTLPIHRSAEPLTLRELIQQLDDGTDEGAPAHSRGLSLLYNDSNAVATDRASLRHFTQIESDAYPQLYEHYEHVFEDWVAGA